MNISRELRNVLPWSWWGTLRAIRDGNARRQRHFRRQHVGPGSYVDPSVQIVGYEHVRIGRSTTISQGCWLNVNHRTPGAICIEIGDSCHVGRGNFISAGPTVTLGDFFFSGLDCRLLGCGHNTATPAEPYLSAGLSAGAPLVIEPNCWLTTGATVLEGVSIGRGSVIGAGSIVTRSIPPFSVAVGLPCKVVRRFSFRRNAWISADEYSAEDERSSPSLQSYLEMLHEADRELPLSLLSASASFGWL